MGLDFGDRLRRISSSSWTQSPLNHPSEVSSAPDDLQEPLFPNVRGEPTRAPRDELRNEG